MSSNEKAPVKKAHKLDIFETLRAIDKKDYGYLDRQPEESAKGFAPPVVLRWTSAVKGPMAEYYLCLTNEIANRRFHDLYEYPDLQYRLLAACGAGSIQRHEWIPMAKEGKTTAKVQSFVGSFFPLASVREIDLLVDMFTTETFNEFVNDSGCSPKEGKDLIDAFKKSQK